MSYPQPVEPRRRPATVTTAAALMVVMALLGLAGAVVTLVTVNGVLADFRADARGAAPGQVNGLAVLLRTYSILAAVLGIVGALLLTGLAVGNLRGVRGARVATWALCGLGLAVGGCGVVGVLLSGVVRLDSATNTDAVVAQALRSAYPDWWLSVNAAMAGGQALGYIAVAALLTLPGAAVYFRRTTPVPPGWPPAGPAPQHPVPNHPVPNHPVR